MESIPIKDPKAFHILESLTIEIVMIIDDFAAREIARTLDLKVTDIIGILIKSLSSKFIDVEKCKDFLHILVENTTFRISSALYSKLLKEIEKTKDYQYNKTMY